MFDTTIKMKNLSQIILEHYADCLQWVLPPVAMMESIYRHVQSSRILQFDNVSFLGQTDRLNMLSEMISTIDEGTSGTAPDATTLLNMYANENSPFSDPALNASSKDLRSKTYSGLGAIDANEIEDYINAFAQDAAMYKDSTWSPGQPGIVTKADGSGSYFLNADGVEYSEIIEKTLMHAVFYYQACEVYTRRKDWRCRGQYNRNTG